MSKKKLSVSEQFEYLTRAATHLVQLSKDRVGLDVELSNVGLESTGIVDLKAITDENLEDDFEDWRQILFSCHVVETLLLGEEVPALEYPKVTNTLQELFLSSGTGRRQ